MPKWARLLVHVLAIALVVTGIGLTLTRRGVVDLPKRHNAPRMETYAFASMLQAVGPTTARVGEAMPLIASAAGVKDAAEVRLFDGARLVAQAPGMSRGGGAALTVPALAVGTHLVHAEITSADGEVSRSVPVPLTVVPGVGSVPIPTQVQVLDGETANDVAARLGVASDTVTLSGQQAWVRVPPDAGLATYSGDAPVVDLPTLTAPLGLTATAQGCGVTLRASGAAGKVHFWHTSIAIPGWAEMKTSGRSSAKLESLAGGPHVFHATDDNGASPEVQVTLPQSCSAKLGWKGDASIVNGILNAPAGNGYYLLLSVDNRPWVRIPDEGAPVGFYPGADMSPWLPALDGHHLELEVWKTPKEFEHPPTTPVATGSLSVPDGSRLADVVGESAALTLTSPDLAPIAYWGPEVTVGHDHRKVTFSWHAASDTVDQVMWQVIAERPGAQDRSLVPNGLLAAGVADAAGGTAKGGGREGTFAIDTAKIPMGGGSLATVTAPTKGGGLSVLTPPIGAADALSLTGVKYAQFTPLATADSAILNPIALPQEGDRVYVRVLASPKNPWAVSSSVQMQLPVHESAETGVTMTLDEVHVDAGRAPYLPALSCVWVDVPWQGTIKKPDGPTGSEPKGAASDATAFTRYVASQFYPTSGIHCAGEFPPPKCDDLLCSAIEFVRDAVGAIVGFVVEVVSLISYAYNGVINAVVDAIAKFNPLCVGLGAAGAGDACATVVGIATRSAVTAALASVGLPPALPSGEAIVAAAQGKFAELAVDFMKSYNVPCDDLKAPPGFGDALDVAAGELGAPKVGKVADNPCLAVASMLIGSVTSAARSAATTSAGSAVGLPSFPEIPGFSMKPDPRAELQPLTVSITAHATKATADTTGAVCTVRGEDPHLPPGKSYAYVAPWTSPLVRLTEQPGKQGTFAGSSAAPVNTVYAIPAEMLQPRTVDVRLVPAGGCAFEPKVVSATIRPPEPDINKVVKEAAKVTLP